MGFVSLCEDRDDRFYESGGSWCDYLPERPDADDTRNRKHIALDVLAVQLVNYYLKPPAKQDAPKSLWEEHLCRVHILHDILARSIGVPSDTSLAIQHFSRIRNELSEFLASAIYGPDTLSTTSLLEEITDEIHRKCEKTVNDLLQFSPKRIARIRANILADLDRLKVARTLARECRKLWPLFMDSVTAFTATHSRRPAFTELDRFDLSPEQARLAIDEYRGPLRLLGHAGTGKTLVLVHRALRLALSHPERRVRVLTVNRTLAHFIKAVIQSRVRTIPTNLAISSFFDLLVEMIRKYAPAIHIRLADPESGERVASNSWNDFLRSAAGDTPALVILTERLQHKVDVNHFIRDEVSYIRSGFALNARSRYLTDPRSGRSVPLRQRGRELMLTVVDRWEEWLLYGELVDPEGVALQVDRLCQDSNLLPELRDEFASHFTLVDEIQDFSTVELNILRTLIWDPSDYNAAFLVGDPLQQNRAIHHNSSEGGWNFRGRTRYLQKCYRNTRQVFSVAWRVRDAHNSGHAEGCKELASPVASSLDGIPPRVLQCPSGAETEAIMCIVQNSTGRRVAVVSNDESLLQSIGHGMSTVGIYCQRLWRNPDLDLWVDLDLVIGPGVFLGDLESVKGWEMDTVIICGARHDVLPPIGLERPDVDRYAAAFYSAATRARDELFVTYTGQPSPFLKQMASGCERYELQMDDMDRLIAAVITKSRELATWTKESVSLFEPE